MQLNKYPLVCVQFWDHSLGSPPIAPVNCEVFGILAHQDDLCYYVLSWIADSNLTDDNNEVYCILKSTVVKLVHIKLGGRNVTKTARRDKESKSPIPKGRKGYGRRP